MVFRSKKQSNRDHFIVGWLFILFSVVEGSNWSVPVGLVMEHNFYTLFGITASVSNQNFLKGHPVATLSITSSRPGAMAGYNVLKKENWLLTAAWHFRPRRYIDPFAALDFGWTAFDSENEELFGKIKNSAPLLNIRTGIGTKLFAGRLIPRIDGGIALIQSSTVFPLFFGISLCYDVMNRGAK
ncbi:MAG: hypothetical protein GX640_24235 [Fibrobacter sp.]|nr:hypothetical protein [Fibrobacter sp.]